MQRALLLSSLIATGAATSFTVQERQSLTQELVAWTQSPAGKDGIANGYYKHLSNFATITDDHLNRLQTTKANIARDQKRNPKATFGLTPFSLMTKEEYGKFVKGSFARAKPAKRAHPIRHGKVNAHKPWTATGDVDWSTGPCVGPVQDQGQCGSCWAFAAVAASESANCMDSNNVFTKFSEQQVTDCDTADGNQGCNGGEPDAAITYIQQNGLCYENDYPYSSGTSGNTGMCEASKCTSHKLNIGAMVDVAQGEDALKQALDTQPVVVVVYAAGSAWQNYQSGVVTDCQDSGQQTDHAVLGVGYGSSGQTSPYFKIRNSWGSSWGEKGYILLEAGVGGTGTCQVASAPTYPTLTHGPSPPGPSPSPPSPTPSSASGSGSTPSSGSGSTPSSGSGSSGSSSQWR